jgi:flagellar biosynthesis component FlhA
MTTGEIIGLIIGLISVIAAFLSMAFCYVQWSKSYKQMEKSLEQSEKSLQQSEKSFEQIEKENRKEVLIKTMIDEKMPLVTRQLAAVEYIDNGYNGIYRSYIMENRLYVKTTN